MPETDLTARFAQELLENEYAWDNLREGAKKLRSGVDAFATGRRRSPRRRGRRLLALLAGLAIGGAIALAANDDLRSSLLGSGSDAEFGADGNRA